MIFAHLLQKSSGWWWGGIFVVLWAFWGGVLDKAVCRRGVFCGEGVVGCVANVDKNTTLCSV
jgi:hypothetical protein